MNRAWIELDRKALEYNIRLTESVMVPGCKIMGVVKANAYGHGAPQIAVALQNMGIDTFAVAAMSEGIALRKCGIRGTILILGETDADRINDLLEYDLTQTIVSAQYAERLADCTAAVTEASQSIYGGRRLHVHVALDTGMHRIGVPYDAIRTIEHIYSIPFFKVDGIFSHLCVADTAEPQHVEFSEMQIERFFDTVDRLRTDGIDVGTVHVQSSYAIFNYSKLPCDFGRLGILMFGTKSAAEDRLDSPTPLKPVMRLCSRITSVREIGVGETVGYGRIFTAQRPTRVASVCIGYADGIPRCLSGGKLRVLVRGQYAQGIGRICMDQMLIDITDIPDACEGDVVTIIGRDGDRVITAEEVAGNADTITNELLSRLGTRIENHGFKE